MPSPSEPLVPRHGPPDPRQIELIDKDFARVLSGKTPAERIAMALDANRFVRLRLAAHLGDLHPDWSGQQIAAEIARRMLYGAE